MMKRLVLTVTTVSVLGSCSIYKKYERPENVVPVDSLYKAELVSGEYNVTASVSDSSSLGYMPWEEVFTDPCLQALIREGLENNTDLLSAALRVEQAQARLKASKWAYSPSLNLAPQGGLTSIEGGPVAWNWNIGAAVSWDIDLFGSLLNAKRGTQAALLQQEAYRQSVRSQLISAIVVHYYSLLMLDEQGSISDRSLQLWREQIRAMEAMFAKGRINENSLTQTRAQMYAAEANALNMKRLKKEMENSLCSILGRVSSPVKRGVLAEQKIQESYELGLPLELLSNRPDVYAAEMALASAYYNTNKARSAFYPKLTLSGSAGWTTSVGQAVANPAGWLLSALASLSQPIFNRGQLTSNLRVSKAEEEIAMLKYRQALLDAGEEVNNAIFAIQTHTQMENKHKAQILDLERTLQTSQALFKAGKVSYLELIVAQQSLYQAQLNLATDTFNKLQAGVVLYRAVGGGR